MNKKLLLSAADLTDLLSVSRATVWRMDSGGKLPKPLRLSTGTTRWRRTDIETWIEAGCPDRGTFEALRNGDGRPGE